MTDVAFSRRLHEKYDAALPRYTSYPTAPHFHPGFGPEAYAQAAGETNEDPLPRALSLYVHVPFCQSLCYYCACNKIITRRTEKAEIYLNYLERELTLQAALFDDDRPVRQLHLGGGTPTYLYDDQLRWLIDAIGERFHLAPWREREFSVEVDPRAVGERTIPVLAELGFDRLSIGVQDFDTQVQEAVNRVQSAAQVRAVIEQSRASGFRSVSLDLIYGLPFQSRESFSATLDEVLDLRPDRLSIYSYAHLPGRVKAQRLIREEDLPTPAEKLSILEMTIERLTAGGYRYIGMDHFALPDSELSRALDEGTLQRNFQGYSTHADCDLIGLGVSAIGKVGDSYAQNERGLKEYYAALNRGQLPVARGYTLSDDDRLRRQVIEQIMCREWVPYSPIERAFGIDFRRYFAPELACLEPLTADELVEPTGEGLCILPAGRLLRRNIAATFDRYLAQAAEVVRYSRSI
ncbi:oxygen-independent coproporphyrinogen III oxidase [Arhodomonas sp. AD133]|uniref:oxygen-independent coproporphyrinogen III oxidase n=1 Tax=Arhodomonas sp. AD133 TaxID=3415009 RepID=UPI003EBDDCF5